MKVWRRLVERVGARRRLEGAIWVAVGWLGSGWVVGLLMCWRNPDLFADLVYGVEAMRGGVERLMGSREAVERFVRLLGENRGRHVLVTADGVSFIGDAGDEIASIVEEQELREFFYSHTPHRDVDHFVFSYENPGWLVVGLGL